MASVSYILNYNNLDSTIYLYYTLRFYFPYLSLLAQPVTRIFQLYRDGEFFLVEETGIH
jgi:hypothetical protein